MEETLQLLTFGVSFFFGFFFHVFSDFHFKVSEKYPVVLKYISTFLFLLDIVLAYIFILYHLNGGVLHVYFLAFVFLGFFSFDVLHKYVKFSDVFRHVIDKFFHK